MSYVSIIAFGLLGLCLAVASQINLVRSRRKIEMAQRHAQDHIASAKVADGDVRSGGMKSLAASVLSQQYKARQTRAHNLGGKRAVKHVKAK